MEKSQASVELFERADNEAGCRCLLAVIDEIDNYIDEISKDTLLVQLVPIDHNALNVRLMIVKEKLSEVIQFFQPTLLDQRMQ